MSGGGRLTADAASLAARLAAFNMADPPEAWTVIIHAPSRVADVTAPAT
jgi:hypothetical protein